MLRLLKILQLMSEVGQIRSVLSGLAHGLHALIFVLLVFSVIFYVYGLMGLMLFGVADEFHFGNVGRALVTMSRMAMGPWHDVMNINLYGCDHRLAATGTEQIRSLYCTEANLLDDGTPNVRSLHEGRPPASGEKLAVNVWVADRPFDSSSDLERAVRT